MGEAMVTGRMAPGKKRRGGLILHREGLTASQAINRMYDCLIEKGDASFLTGNITAEDEEAWFRAADFVDALSEKKDVAPLTSPYAAAYAAAQPPATPAGQTAAGASAGQVASVARGEQAPTFANASPASHNHANEQGAN